MVYLEGPVQSVNTLDDKNSPKTRGWWCSWNRGSLCTGHRCQIWTSPLDKLKKRRSGKNIWGESKICDLLKVTQHKSFIITVSLHDLGQTECAIMLPDGGNSQTITRYKGYKIQTVSPMNLIVNSGLRGHMCSSLTHCLSGSVSDPFWIMSR